MNQYKYALDKSSRKFICPTCGKKRFVRYINQSTLEYLEEPFGRCDRETNCGYHNPPKFSFSNTIVSNTKPQVIQDFIEPKIVVQSLQKYDENNFVNFLKVHFSKEEVENCISKYRIGTSKLWKGATVFWQINNNHKTHTGKIMLFNAQTGKRVKEPFPHISWAHKKIKFENFNLKQCLFGLHFLNDYQNNSNTEKRKTVAIVESEKTAIIMSLFIPDCQWLATGSKQNFKNELLLPIKKERIVVYPDKGEFKDWNKKVDELQKIGYKIKISTVVENSKYDVGSDLADIYFALNEPFIGKKNTELRYSETELVVQRISQTNPLIYSLIETFDLIDSNGNGIRTI
uniref:DUF6371 domain-containing protein n=1 Tax=Flavobacterium sp. TaxID=239 RepID=UPI0040497428